MMPIKTLVLLAILLNVALNANLKKRHHGEDEEEEHREPKHNRKNKHRNVYIYNKHYHINQPSSVLTTQPNIHSLTTTQALVHNDIHDIHNVHDLHTLHDIHEIPHTHYVPQVHWVDDTLQAHTHVIDHDDHIHTITHATASPSLTVSGLMTNIAPSTTHLIHPTMGKYNYLTIVSSVTPHLHLDHYHDDIHYNSPATYPVSNSHEGKSNIKLAALVYDNMVAPNPAHYHSPVKFY
jgi:hypothetical protein